MRLLPDPPICRPPRPRRAAAGLLALLALSAAACGGTPRPAGGGRAPALLVGRRGTPPSQLLGAARTAGRFARAYAIGAYGRRAPDAPGESRMVRRALAAAAGRVPPARRGLHPRLLGLRLRPLGRGELGATARIGDGRYPPFTIGFTISRRGGRWIVTTISLPD